MAGVRLSTFIRVTVLKAHNPPKWILSLSPFTKEEMHSEQESDLRS